MTRLLFLILILSGLNGTGYASTAQIKCDSLGDGGIASAYLPYTFYLDGASSISDIKWRMELPDSNGDYITSQASDSESFVITALTNADAYSHTADGTILGRIVCTGVTDGGEVEATCTITLDLKPKILSVKILDMTPDENNPTYYDTTVEVRYEGSSYISGILEEEHFSGVSYYNSTVPHLARFRLKTVDSWGDARFTLTAKNEYGTATYELTIPAPQPDGCTQIKENVKCVSIYNTDGTFIKRVRNLGNGAETGLNKGIYILKIQTDHHCITKKMAIR